MSRLARPHWVDPTSNIIYDTNNADFEGWLTKQSMWLKVNGSRRFVVEQLFRVGFNPSSGLSFVHCLSHTVKFIHDIDRTGDAVTLY